jgi:hypothetical protein
VLRPNIVEPRNDGGGVPGVVPLNIFPSAPPGTKIHIAELRLSAEAKVHRFESKAGFAIAHDYYALNSSTKKDDDGIDPSQVIDLTSRMQPDGSLNWTPPAGNWRILRLGYSLTGKTNHPATAEATGLEVDKFDAAAVRQYLESYLQLYRDAVGVEHIGNKGVRALLTDSIEVGASNWTPRMADQFKRLRGYDPKPWLPALTGTIIGSREQSDAFLYDFRHTLAELLATEHYRTVAQIAHEHGLIVYGEALESNRPTLGDDMEMRSHADVPMAALWSYARNAPPRCTHLGDMKGASSVAHIYGQNIVAAESLTSMMAPWAYAPADLRPMIDLEFAYGVNRPSLHSSVHQPVDDKVPGLSLAIFGQHFNRHETWADMARPWIDYIARTSFLLQQGHNVADVAYFYGEEQPLTALFAQGQLKDTPSHHSYDFVNSDVLFNRLAVEEGSLTAKSGARYRLLYLGGTSEYMTLPVLHRIAELAEAGATIVGAAPKGSPSLNDDASQFGALVSRLWSGSAETAIGKGRVIASRNLDAALSSIGLKPAFSYDGPQTDSALLFVHRQFTDGELFFVSNRVHRPESIQARFRIAGKQPEIWHADTGATEAVSYRIKSDETTIPLEFNADESLFVVFRKSTTKQQAIVEKLKYVSVAELTGSWNISFQAGRGAPAPTQFAKLHPLGEDAEPGIKYFSGVATYTQHFDLPKDFKAGTPLLLDLGNVGDVAEVRVNGALIGTTWKVPRRVDVSGAVKAGSNELEVRVANLWVNRLIGDAQPDAKKITFTALPTYLPDAPLRSAGLIGPVRLLSATP